MLQNQHKSGFTSDMLGDTGNWDHVTIGDYGSDPTKYTPADLTQRSYPTTAEQDDIVIERKYNPKVDGQIVAKKKQLHNTLGTLSPLDIVDGKLQANEQPYRVRIVKITSPERDSNSSEVSMISMTLSVGDGSE